MNSMDAELADFLASSKCLTEESVTWGDTLSLHVTYYLGVESPPLRYVSSVRAIVFRRDAVIVVRDAENHFHTVPGGRREGEEIPEETLRREVLEETGWTLKNVSPLGFMHFYHLAPAPTDYAYPYPDFLWLIYAAEADKHLPEFQIPDTYEIEVGFHPISEARGLLIEPGCQMLLDAAAELRLS
jgi:8-oxo-dGTP pyrophosphatase MutT (NUDIX family)